MMASSEGLSLLIRILCLKTNSKLVDEDIKIEKSSELKDETK